MTLMATAPADVNADDGPLYRYVPLVVEVGLACGLGRLKRTGETTRPRIIGVGRAAVV